MSKKIGAEMIPEQRKEVILRKIGEDQVVRVADLAELLQVTPETIRKDLDELSKANLIRRVYGGATAINQRRGIEPSFDVRRAIQLEHKRQIAREASKIVLPGDSLILDHGSTCLELARAIEGIPRLLVVTHSLEIASVLGSRRDVKVFLLGGWLRGAEPSTYGESCISLLKSFHADKAFLSTAGISAEQGLTDYFEEDISVKRHAIEAAEQVIIMADYTKFTTTALITVAPITKIDFVYTDNLAPEEEIRKIKDLGIQVVQVNVAPKHDE